MEVSQNKKTNFVVRLQCRLYGTFFGDDIWQALTDQARIDGKIDSMTTVNEIAASWITKDRLPVLNVTRNYAQKTATLTQVCWPQILAIYKNQKLLL